MKLIATTLAALLIALTLSATPAHARPTNGSRLYPHTGSCARVAIGFLGACDFPIYKQKHRAKMRRCYRPAFREHHPVRCERWLKKNGTGQW